MYLDGVKDLVIGVANDGGSPRADVVRVLVSATTSNKRTGSGARVLRKSMEQEVVIKYKSGRVLLQYLSCCT